jgi:AraC family transcriptional regulator of adaptative response / DNA-3-methyladenine glycosylase II
VPLLDHDHCYSVVQSRDRRFDGWFVTAVRTTGIYCRPSCSAITPKRTNVEFHPTAAAAQQRGFRACKRCRPDASPGSPEWNLRQDVVGRAMRLIADGTIERDGVPGLARQLGYSERQLNRLMTDELGAGPLAIARAHRAHTARLLIETTAMPFTDVAFASGFGSVRQFNDTVRDVFASTPTELRARRTVRPNGRDAVAPSGEVVLRLPTRQPFPGAAVLEFLGARAIPHIEVWDGQTYRRSLSLPGGHGVVALRAHDDHVEASVRLVSWADLATAVQRIRRLLDLDSDPEAVDAALSTTASMRALVRALPGRRAPGSVDPYETSVRAVVGQQVSVAGARTVAGRIVESCGQRLEIDDDDLTHVFPSPERLAVAEDSAFSMPTARRDTIRRVAAAVADGAVRLDVGVEPDVARAELIALKGIGPWTADYVVMRGLSHPDRFLDSDLGVMHALTALDLTLEAVAEWAPWRSYAVHHLWASLGGGATVTTDRKRTS